MFRDLRPSLHMSKFVKHNYRRDCITSPARQHHIFTQKGGGGQVIYWVKERVGAQLNRETQGEETVSW